MMVQCFHRPRRPDAYRGGGTVIRAQAALPFVESAWGRYSHRVRYAELHDLGGRWKPHMAVGCWCGLTLLISERKPGRLVETPTAGYVICATCEGRAIGSGQLGAREIAGREVAFAPRWQGRLLPAAP